MPFVLDNFVLQDRLIELRQNLPVGQPIDPTTLASAFGWAADHVRSRNIEAGDEHLQVARGYSGVQPAALFATGVDNETRSLLDLAALYGYHASVRWGLYADGAGITPFNSHWLNGDRWFHLPKIRWDDIESNIDLLRAFQPQELIDGTPDRLALAQRPSPTLLQPVDDELVERLDRWREEALATSRLDSGVDEQLQTLFAKLFVLRTIEDRGLAPDVPALSTALIGPDRLNTDQLISIFENARSYIGSELFFVISLDMIPTHVVAGVIRDLYYPYRVGFGGNKYNFSWIDSDVLGLAYEKYLSTILHPVAPTPQFDLFHGGARTVERISVRKAGGVYYTPQYLTKYLADKCIDDFYSRHDLDVFPKIIDFACGSGSFLVAAMDALLRRLKEFDPVRDWGRELIEGGFISGVDIDEKAVTVARLNLWNRLAEEPNPLPLPNLSRAVIQGDGLDQSGWTGLPQLFDIVLGNPPFLATSRVANRESLEQRFETATGRYDFSYLFVEQAINVTAPSGTIGMVTPNRLFRNANGGEIRNHLTSRMDLITVVDFGSNEVFQGASAYIGCFVARHIQILSPLASSVQVIEVRKLPEQYVSAFLLNPAQFNSGEVRVYEAQHPRGRGAWYLLSPDEKRAQVQLSDASEALSEVCGIFQGIRTGANDVFILGVESEDERFGVQVRNGLGDAAILELDLLEPVVFGSEVRRFSHVEPNKYLLYPYQDGIVLSEAEIELQYPLTFNYLISYRDILAARTSISVSGLRWFELVRRRDIDWLRKPKLLIRDLAPETAFAVDPTGGIFMVGGTAVVPESEELLYPLLSYLNSKPINVLMRRITPEFRGGFQKFEPQHLQQIPVLRSILDDSATRERLGTLGLAITESSDAARSRALTAELDTLVNDLFEAAGVGRVE